MNFSWTSQCFTATPQWLRSAAGDGPKDSQSKFLRNRMKSEWPQFWVLKLWSQDWFIHCGPLTCCPLGITAWVQTRERARIYVLFICVIVCHWNPNEFPHLFPMERASWNYWNLNENLQKKIRERPFCQSPVCSQVLNQLFAEKDCIYLARIFHINHLLFSLEWFKWQWQCNGIKQLLQSLSQH